MNNDFVEQLLSTEAPPSPLSSRPERTRISYSALLATTTCAALHEESRMQSLKATGLHRKSGGAQWRDLCMDALSWKCFSCRVAKENLSDETKNLPAVPGGYRNCRRCTQSARLRCSAPQNEDYPGACVLATKPQPAAQPERRGRHGRDRCRHHWHRRGRRERYACRHRPAD